MRFHRLLDVVLAGSLLLWAPTPSALAGGNDLVLPAPFFTAAQGKFKDLSETLGLMISYKPVAPAEPLGILGFDAGIELAATDIDEDAAFIKDALSEADPPSVMLTPKLHVQKGLPFGIDVGGIYSQFPDSNIALIGGEVKWALLKGTIATPALAVRGSYTRLLGVGALDLDTFGADVSISKGFAFLTPYLGVGQVWINSRSNVPALGLSDERLSRTKGFVGLKVKLLLLSLVAEAELSAVNTFSFRGNLSF